MSRTQLFISDAIFTGQREQPLISGAILAHDGIIEEIMTDYPDRSMFSKADRVIDYRGQLICPGLIDSHTHLVHGGSRENELMQKLNGLSYMEIHAAGGGIFSTVRSSLKASEEELFTKARANLETMLAHGTTTVESKSGYCLDLEGELKLLRVNQRLAESQAQDLVVTYMGAHATPPNYPGGHQAYIDDMLWQIMPEVKRQGIAEFVDIFCEEGIFSLEETELIAKRAHDLGFKLKVHADEIVSMGGAGKAADLGAVSAEHLMQIRPDDISKLAAAGTVAVLLPATSYFLMSPQYAPARQMIEAGVTVALATDFNPGSCPCPNLQMVMSLAAFQMKLTPLEILFGVTINAAKAIDRQEQIGSFCPGKQMDLVAFKVNSPEKLIYSFGQNLVADVWKKAELVHRNI